MEYEWAVFRDGDDSEIHRGPMAEHEAREWVREWRDDFADTSTAIGMFYVARRPVGDWEPA